MIAARRDERAADTRSACGTPAGVLGRYVEDGGCPLGPAQRSRCGPIARRSRLLVKYLGSPGPRLAVGSSVFSQNLFDPRPRVTEPCVSEPRVTDPCVSEPRSPRPVRASYQQSVTVTPDLCGPLSTLFENE